MVEVKATKEKYTLIEALMMSFSNDVLIICAR